MSNKTGQIILIAMLAGVVLGAVGGYFMPEPMSEIRFLGVIFLNALKLIAIPLVILSMIVGVTSLGDIRRLGRTGGKTLVYFLITTFIAVLLGIILVNLIRPGVGMTAFNAGVPDLVGSGRTMTFMDIIVSMVPDNIFRAAVDGEFLGLIVFALIFGGALTTLGASAKPVIDFIETLNRAIMKIVELIIYFAPIGVLALIGGIVADNRDSLGQLGSGLGWYTLTVLAGLVIHGAIILPLILKFIGKQDPVKYAMNMGQAFATAFTTSSSSATLPVNMTAVIDKNKIDKRAGSFVLPLGATINMDGTALYEAVAAIFIAQIYGIDLTIGQQVIVFFTATLASIGAAGIPHAGTVTMIFVLSAVGLPIEGIGLIWAVDWFLDRCRTTVNIWGDAVGAAVIAQTKELGGGIRTAVGVAAGGEKRPDKLYVHRSRERQDRNERPERRERPVRPDRQERQDRPERPERQERRERPDRPERQERYDRGQRSGGQRGREYQSKGRRYEERGGGYRKQRSEEQRKPSVSPDYVKKELEEIRKLRAPVIPVGDAEPIAESVETAPAEVVKKEEFFDIDVSKIEFFPEEKKEPEKVEPESDFVSMEPQTHEASVPEQQPEPVQEDTVKPENETEEDSWGRIKRKHPGR